MKCNSIIIYYKEKTKSSKPRVFATISPAHHSEEGWLDNLLKRIGKNGYEKLNLDGFGHCDGSIIATVVAVDEPYFGGTYSLLEVMYKCDKCGQSYFGNILPNENNISEWVTKRISEIES